MYKFTDHNRHDDISLHDCWATKLISQGDNLTFIFPNGLGLAANNRHNYLKRPAYTGAAEVNFKTLYRDMASNLTVYLFTETADPNRAIRELIPLAQFIEWLEAGQELEFLYSYQGYQAYIFECWLWFDNPPYHKECMLFISATEATYSWNTLQEE